MDLLPCLSFLALVGEMRGGGSAVTSPTYPKVGKTCRNPPREAAGCK